MRRRPVEAPTCSPSCAPALRYVMASVPIRTALLLLAIVSRDGDAVHRADAGDRRRRAARRPEHARLLMTATGVGALGGALYLASRESVVGLGRVSTISTIAFGAGLIAFASTRSVWSPLLVLPHRRRRASWCRWPSTNTILQTIVDDHLRGRVMAFYTMAFLRHRADRQPARRAWLAGPHRRAMDDCALRRGLCRRRRCGSRAGCRRCGRSCGRSTSSAASCRSRLSTAAPRRSDRRVHRATRSGLVTSRCRGAGRTPSSSLLPTTSAPRARAARDGRDACTARSRSR